LKAELGAIEARIDVVDFRAPEDAGNAVESSTVLTRLEG
jgi:hypothetical protein